MVHPVVVFPMARGPLKLLALACGAIAPDLPYYVRATPLPVTAESWYEPYLNATTSHSLSGLLTASVPLALVAYLCARLALPPLHWMVGIDPRTDRTPDLRRRLKTGVWTLLALTIGVLTHLAWDGLTELGDADSRFFQHASTALGVVVLVVIAWRRRTVLNWHETTARRRLLKVAALCLLAFVIGAVLASRSWFAPAFGFSTEEVVEGIVTAVAKGGSAGLVAMAAVLTLTWWTVQLLNQNRDPARHQ